MIVRITLRFGTEHHTTKALVAGATDYVEGVTSKIAEWVLLKRGSSLREMGVETKLGASSFKFIF